MVGITCETGIQKRKRLMSPWRKEASGSRLSSMGISNGAPLTRRDEGWRLQRKLSTNCSLGTSRKKSPQIRAEINEKFERARIDLPGLGRSGQTENEQLKFLVNLAVNYQGRVAEALNGRYPALSSTFPKLRIRV